jgi:hypothetical protein
MSDIKLITLDELKKHNSKDDAVIYLLNRVDKQKTFFFF